ncbi:hypothetical protein CYFUS_005292 [Cystobacter fuscus]|uniref:Bulb-type lectin domain-containing protein n=1 Tax=Cystobacter fuscus TaxID=43 RepID=A0A250J7E0_9BACT|nr:caspase family protein [Cystobacter fuscus]ATB39844.1 hypothetical protein CYFUS_005292 [Cystobacter fuscus]
MRDFPFDPVRLDLERGLAVVIGINTYAHGITPLCNAVRDAQAVADTLERQGFEVLRLLDEQATLSTLSALLTGQLASRPSPPDRLLIYFAGHGLAHTDDANRLSGYLLPVDARRDEPSTYWRMDALRDALRELPCRHLLLLLDCCFAGAFPHVPSRDLRAPASCAPLYLERFRHFSSRRSFQLLASTAHDELASDRLLAKPAQEARGDGRHSPFALALLQALQHPSPADTNQDGLLTASELYTFLRDRLVDLMPSPSPQTPALWPLDGHDSGEFLFLLSEAFPTLPLAAPLSRHSNPYLGLRPFASTHRHLFFGRERLVDALHGHLRVQPLLLLCGPSGAGKSSAVHAGLLPRLGDDPAWRIPRSLRPSARPLHALSSWLAALEPGRAVPSAASLAETPRAAAACVLSFLARHEDLSLLLVVDPLEELVTTCPDDATRGAFLQAMGALLQAGHPRLRLLWLLRSDYEPHFHALLRPAGVPAEPWHGGRQPLTPMNRDELRRCIEKPAEASVLFFEPGLIERLLDDVEQMPGALPLLSVALSELFDACLTSGRDDRTLGFDDYRGIGGGIAGALQRRAELVFAGEPPPATDGQTSQLRPGPGELPAFQHTLRNVLLRMVSPEEGGLARRRVPRAELEYTSPEENRRVQRALRTLEACRLVVASDDAGPCVEPAHDALLSAWPRLHEWTLQARRELLLLRRVSHAASEWHRHGRGRDFLWADGRLEQLELAPTALHRQEAPLSLNTVSARGPEPLDFNAAESAFLRASATRRRQLLTRRSAVALSVGLALVLLTVVALFQADRAHAKAEEAEASAQEARQRKEEAEASAREAHAQQERAEHHAEEARRQEAAALSNFAEAQRQRESSERHAREALEQQRLAEANAREALNQKQLAEANAREAQRQQEAAEANARRAREQQQLAEANAREASTQRNASEANAREARRQQETAEANAREAQRQEEVATTNAREARRQQETAEANAWEAQRQKEAAEANAREVLTQKELAEANARRARTQQEAAETNAREARRQQALVQLNVRLARVRTLIDKNPTQAMLALREVFGQDAASRNDWQQSALQTSQRVISRAVLAGHEGDVNTVVLSPDGLQVLTTASDGHARLWRADGRGPPRILEGSRQPLNSAVFSPDGSLILAASDDKTALLWSTHDTIRPLHTFKGHRKPVNSAVFSPDGFLILTASDDKTARLWHVDGELVSELTGHKKEVSSAVFSPDGSLVLTASDDKTARLWNRSGEELRRFTGHQDVLVSASFSPDGSRILTVANDKTARLWSKDEKKALNVFAAHSGFVSSAAFSPDGTHIVTSSDDGTALLWRVDAEEAERIFTGHAYGVNSAVFSPDGTLILTASEDGTARLWRTDGKDEPFVLSGHLERVNSASFSPDGSLVLTASDDGTARLWPIRGAGTPFFFTEMEFNVPMALSPDGSRLLTISWGNTVDLFNTDGTGQLVDMFHEHTNSVNTAAFSPDGALILTAADDGTAHVRNRRDMKRPPRILDTGQKTSTSALFSPDGSQILTISNGRRARLWHTEETDSSSFGLKDSGCDMSFATFSPDGAALLSDGAKQGSVCLWRTARKQAPRVLKGATGTATSATFSPDGDHFIVAFDNGEARLWDTRNLTQPPRVLGDHQGPLNTATFSPDGAFILTASDEEKAHLWRTDGSDRPRELKGHTDYVTSARFTPDGSHVLTASDDGTARLWPVNGQGHPFILRHEERMDFHASLHAMITRDGTRIVTACENGLVRVWPLQPEPLLEYFQNATTVCLSALEREEYLLEDAATAQVGYETCERAQGRLP